MGLISVRVYATYGKECWEAFGLWVQTESFPPLLPVLVNITSCLVGGPDGSGQMHPDDLQVLIQNDDQVALKREGIWRDPTDVAMGRFYGLRWNKVPEPSFVEFNIEPEDPR